ncbi:MAG: alpha/beta fold hydrolase [Chloroflexi bacterium]|nr:alpha/beta fold hydrolase [Chloroflexota bacterium]
MDQIYHIPSDGLEIAAEVFGAGEPLVFAHGLTGNRHFTRAQFAPLSDRYRIVIYDQRGHCNSTPVTDPTLYDLSRMADDMATVMDYFQIERAIVGGESMGAATTLQFVFRHPERVKTLLLTVPAFGDAPNPAAEEIRNMGREIAELGMAGFLKNSAQRLSEKGATPDVIAVIAKMQSSHDPASLAVACQTVIDWVMDDFSRLRKIQAPTCVIGWPNDNLHPYALAQQVAATIPGARLETMPSLVELFRNPAVVGRIYERFLIDLSANLGESRE